MRVEPQLLRLREAHPNPILPIVEAKTDAIPISLLLDLHFARGSSLEQHVHQVRESPKPLGHVLTNLSERHASSPQKVEKLLRQKASDFTGCLGRGYLTLKPGSQL